MSNEAFYKLIRPIVILLYIVLGIVAFKFLMDYVLRWVLPFIIGFILSRMALPLCRQFVKKARMPKKFASFLATLLVFSLFLGILAGLFFFLYRGVLPFVVNLEKLYTEVSAQLIATSEKVMEYFSSLPAAWQEGLEKAMTGLPERIDFVSLVGKPLLKVVGNVPLMLFSVIATVLSTFFFVTDDERIRIVAAKFFKPDLHAKITRLYRHLFSSFFKWLKAQTILATVCAIELLIGFLILGLEHAFLLAFTIALIDFLPVLGAGGVLIPWAIVALIMGNYKLAVGLIILYAVILVVRNALEPSVLGQQIGMHPLVTLFGIYLGFRMYGVLGMLMVPLALITVIQLNRWGYIRLWGEKETPPPEET